MSEGDATKPRGIGHLTLPRRNYEKIISLALALSFISGYFSALAANTLDDIISLKARLVYS